MGVCKSVARKVCCRHDDEPPSTPRALYITHSQLHHKKPIPPQRQPSVSVIQNPFAIPSLLSYGGFRSAWDALEPMYRQQTRTLGADHADTVITLKQLCACACEVYTLQERDEEWEAFLAILLNRFHDRSLDHADKIDLVESVADYLTSRNPPLAEVTAGWLYDELRDRLSELLGVSHELTIYVQQCKAGYYVRARKLEESWKLLETVHEKQLKIGLDTRRTVELMCDVAGKLLHRNHKPFLHCMAVLENLSLMPDTSAMLTTLRTLANIATVQIDEEAALNVYDTVLEFLDQQLGDRHDNTHVCLAAKAQFLVSKNHLQQAWSIIRELHELRGEPVPGKPKEKYVMQAIVCDLLCKCDLERCSHDLHPLTPDTYEVDPE